jgi:hypothetical protein
VIFGDIKLLKWPRWVKKGEQKERQAWNVSLPRQGREMCKLRNRYSEVWKCWVG